MEKKSKYSHEIEDKWYKFWSENNFFESNPNEQEPYTIIMPPPNITGILHIGHFLNITLQDILIRNARLKGKNACFIPGLDHASLATEIKIKKHLSKQGINPNTLSKEEFLEKCWEWKEEHQNIIISQLKKMGCSADWSRLCFTMDKHHTDRIYEIYEKLKEDNYIYKDIKALHYDPKMKTNISEHEIKEEKRNGKIILISERSNAEIEIRESEQLFLKMDDISKPAIDMIKDGTIELIPESRTNSYESWFKELKDWCISREISWGHEIPDTDFTFDTWFSSWLWSYSIFKTKEEFEYYFPTQIIISGYDISFFWLAKMIMASSYMLDSKPFDKIYLTGLMRDKNGKKFSKQLGNSPDILKLIDEYGADSLRYALLINHQAGLDCKWNPQNIIQGKKFCNKMWNIQHLLKSWTPSEIEMNETQRNSLYGMEEKCENIFKEIDSQLDNHKFSDSFISIYKLIWNEFCSEYLEQIKPNEEEYPNINQELYDSTITIFENLLKKLHPFMPFITEELWQSIRFRKENDTIMF